MTNEQNEQAADVGQNDLIDTQGRGNTVRGNNLESIENTGKLPRRPACEVTIRFAEKPDEAAIADVLRVLMSIGIRR